MFHKRFPRRTSGFFSNFYCSPPPFPPIANPKNGTIPVLHVSLPALGCPHQQPVGDGMKQPPCPGGLTTILPLSRLYQQLQPTCSGSQSDLQKEKLCLLFQSFLQASKAAGSSWAATSQGCGQVEGNEPPVASWSSWGQKGLGSCVDFSKENQQEIQEINQIQDVAAIPRSVLATPHRGLLCWEGVTPVPRFFSKVWKTWEPLM